MAKHSKSILMYMVLALVSAIVLMLSTTAITAQSSYPSYPTGNTENTDITDNTENPPSATFEDGRANNNGDGSVIYFSNGNESVPPIQIYNVDPSTGIGIPSLIITQEDIDAAGIPTSGFVVIAEGINQFTGYPITIYRLSTGEFQVNTYDIYGKLIETIWS